MAKTQLSLSPSRDLGDASALPYIVIAVGLSCRIMFIRARSLVVAPFSWPRSVKTSCVSSPTFESSYQLALKLPHQLELARLSILKRQLTATQAVVSSFLPKGARRACRTTVGAGKCLGCDAKSQIVVGDLLMSEAGECQVNHRGQVLVERRGSPVAACSGVSTRCDLTVAPSTPPRVNSFPAPQKVRITPVLARAPTARLMPWGKSARRIRTGFPSV